MHLMKKISKGEISMLKIKDIFKKFDEVNAYTFSTIDGDYPEVRIAHFLTFDEEGLYFQTMKVKPFYRQLSETNKEIGRASCRERV